MCVIIESQVRLQKTGAEAPTATEFVFSDWYRDARPVPLGLRIDEFDVTLEFLNEDNVCYDIHECYSILGQD